MSKSNTPFNPMTLLLLVGIFGVSIFVGNAFYSKSIKNTSNDVLNNPKVTATPTYSPKASEVAVVTQNQLQNQYTSKDLDISFIIPDGVVIKEVDSPYSPTGAAGCGLSREEAMTKSYKGIEAWFNNKEILFIGQSQDCLGETFEDAPIAFETSVNGEKYVLKKLSTNTFMTKPVTFGENSKIKLGKAFSNDAVISGDLNYSEEMFDKAVEIISSIQSL